MAFSPVVIFLAGCFAGHCAAIADALFVPDEKSEARFVWNGFVSARAVFPFAGAPFQETDAIGYELAAGILTLGFYVAGVPLVLSLALSSALIAAAAIDLKHHLVPDIASVTLLFAGVIYQITRGEVVLSLAVAASIAIGLLAIHWFHRSATGRAGLGLGDVKFLAAGALWFSPFGVAMWIALSCLLALAWIVWKRRAQTENEHPLGVPLIPFAVAAFLPAILLQAVPSDMVL